MSNLRAIGVEAEELEDGMVILGSDRPLRGRVITHGDHRLAMAFGVLGAAEGNDIEIVDAEDKVQAFLDVIEPMLQGGMVTMENVRVRHYQPKGS